mmetsp:Transcript_23595/g.42554  ORF Transcript_23595/g.42554 Transcript_23595/m.42554 type:complete len:278 (+) Transcript_23595:37-870(+)
MGSLRPRGRGDGPAPGDRGLAAAKHGDLELRMLPRDVSERRHAGRTPWGHLESQRLDGWGAGLHADTTDQVCWGAQRRGGGLQAAAASNPLGLEDMPAPPVVCTAVGVQWRAAGPPACGLSIGQSHVRILVASELAGIAEEDVHLRAPHLHRVRPLLWPLGADLLGLQVSRQAHVQPISGLKLQQVPVPGALDALPAPHGLQAAVPERHAVVVAGIVHCTEPPLRGVEHDDIAAVRGLPEVRAPPGQLLQLADPERHRRSRELHGSSVSCQRGCQRG